LSGISTVRPGRQSRICGIAAAAAFYRPVTQTVAPMHTHTPAFFSGETWVNQLPP